MKSRKTARDYFMMGLFIPTLLLVTLLVGSAASWQMQDAKIKLLLKRQFGEGVAVAQSPVRVVQTSTTSSVQTDRLVELYRAVAALHEKYADLIGYLEDEGPELQTYRQRYLEDAEPLLAAFDEVDFSGKPIRLPDEDGTESGWFGDVLLRRELWMMQTVVLAVIPQDDPSLALDQLRRMKTLAKATPPLRTIVAELERLRTLDSLFASIVNTLPRVRWSADQLEEVDGWLSQSYFDNADWQQVLDTHRLLNIRRLRADVPFDPYNQFPFTPRMTVAPSERLYWLGFAPVQEHASLSIGSWPQSIKPTQLDKLLQFPFAEVDHWAEANKSWAVGGYSQTQDRRRYARTAVALSRYHLAQGEYPNELSELSEVGLRPEDQQGFGSPFQYKVLPSGDATLSNIGPDTTESLLHISGWRDSITLRASRAGD